MDERQELREFILNNVEPVEEKTSYFKSLGKASDKHLDDIHAKSKSGVIRGLAKSRVNRKLARMAAVSNPLMHYKASKLRKSSKK